MYLPLHLKLLELIIIRKKPIFAIVIPNFFLNQAKKYLLIFPFF